MKKLFISAILLFAFIIVFALDFSAQIVGSNSEPTIISIEGASEAIFSPSGKFLSIKISSNFVVLSTKDLEKSLNDLPNKRKWEGQPVGFLPSDELFYIFQNETYKLEPATQKSRKMFTRNLVDYKRELDLTHKDIVIVSTDLIISGNGNYDWGGEKGNIIRFNLKDGQVSKGAEIWDFWYAYLSPSGRYILYEHGAEDNNNADIYDITKNKNYPVAKYFNLKKIFPKYKETDEMPVAFLKNQDSFLAQINQNDDESDDQNWLVLFDVSSKKVIWKKLIDGWFFPSEFQQLNNDKAFITLGEEIYNLNLKSGELQKNSIISGRLLSISRDGSKIAFLESNKLFTISPDGTGRKLLLDLPPNWEFQKAYKGMGERLPEWSIDNNWLVLFGENQLLFVQP